MAVGLALAAWSGASPAVAQSIRVKADSPAALVNTNSWVERIVPGSVDTARWDSTVTTNATSTMGANLAWGAIQLVDPTPAITIAFGNTLTIYGVNSVGIDMSAATTNLTIQSNVVLAGPQRWEVAAGRTLTLGVTGFSGELQALAAHTLTKAGPGTLALRGVSGNSSHAALTRVVDGTLELAKDTGNVVAIGGGGLTIGDTNDAPPVARVVLTGASFNLIGGSAITIQKTGVLDTNGRGEDGAGAVRLYGTNDTCGVITNSAGEGSTVVIGSTLSFVGGGAIDLGTGTIVRLNGNVSYTNALDGQAARLAGAAALNLGTLTFTVADDPALDVELAIPAHLSGNNNLAKSGAGRMRLSGHNTFTGSTTINSPGVLRMAGANALGTGSSTTVNSGGALELEGDLFTAAEALTLNGTGVSAGGALRNVTGNNTYAGTIGMGSAVRINADAGTLTLGSAAGITSAQDLQVGGQGDVVVARALQTGVHTLTKDGTGTLTLLATNTYTGVTRVSDGTLRVTGRLSSSHVAVASGATLSGAGVIALSVTNAAGGRLAPGDGAVGTMTSGTLDLQAGSLLEFEFQDAPEMNDQWAVTNLAGLAIHGGVFSLFAAGTTNSWVPPGGFATVNLIAYRGAIGGIGIDALQVANARPRYAYTFGTNGSWVFLSISNAAAPSGMVVTIR